MPKRKVYTPEAFELAVADFAKMFGIATDDALRRVGLDMHDQIVGMTPRDTGLAQAAWRFTVDYIDASVPAKGAYPEGAAKKGREAEAEKVTGDSTIHLSNNLPYILPLEHGHSKQAPGGMVAVTTANFRNWMVGAMKEETAKRHL